MAPQLGYCPKCEVFECKPTNVLFKFDVGSTNYIAEAVNITNKTDEPQTIKIRNPLTPYFHLGTFLQQGTLEPKGVIKAYVNFRTTRESRGYHDCFSIECNRGCHLEVRIEATPRIKEFSGLPKEIRFGHVPLGQVRKRKIILEPRKEDFPFLFVLLKPSEVTISPSRGVVGKEAVEIEIVYRPLSYTTLTLPVNVYLPSIIQMPFTMHISAHTKPGFVRNQLLQEAKGGDFKEDKYIYRVPSGAKPVPGKGPKDKIPPMTQHDVNVYLMKDIPHVADYELKGPFGRYLEDESAIRCKKEKEFFDLVYQIKRENAIAHSHEKPKLRTLTVDVFKRERLKQEYLNEKNNVNQDISYGPQYLRIRTIRDLREKHNFKFTGPERKPNEWFVRYMSMVKFVNAARTVLVKRRMEKVLDKLKKLTEEDIARLEAQGLAKKEVD